MRVVIFLAAGIALCIAVGWGILRVINRPLSQEEGTIQINKRLAKIVEKNASLSSALLTIYSSKTGYFEQFAAGVKNRSTETPVGANSQYHAASIGKTMCAVVFGQLVDEGKLSYDDKIASWLDEDVLKGLFIADGIDYKDQVTIRQLLNHTSGVGDYFEGPVNSGKPMLETISSNPDRVFTPSKLLAFTRDHQKPVGKPGQSFYYSDTGYILLGFILEAIESRAYSDILQERIFEPLGMADSYLMLYNDAPADLIGFYINGIDYSRKKALSVDWAGGGVVTTMKDLLTFMRALENREMLSDETYKQMTDFKHRYAKGIYYGMGMMYFNFGELSFLLGSMTNLYGGVGATGTYMLYDKTKDTYFIVNFGSLDFREKGIQELVRIRMMYDRMTAD